MPSDEILKNCGEVPDLLALVSLLESSRRDDEVLNVDGHVFSHHLVGFSIRVRIYLRDYQRRDIMSGKPLADIFDRHALRMRYDVM